MKMRFHCIPSAQQCMSLNKHQSSSHFMLPNVWRQTATPRQAITNSNEKGEGGISPSQPCLICRLLGNWNVPLLCCCLKVCEARKWMPYRYLGGWGEGEKKEAEKEDKLDKLAWFCTWSIAPKLKHTPTQAETERHALMPGALQPCTGPRGDVPDNTN